MPTTIPLTMYGASAGSGYCNTPAHSLAAGTYYVKVNAHADFDSGIDDADYQLKVSYTPATPAPAPAPAPKPTSKPTPAGKGTPVPVYRVYNKNVPVCIITRRTLDEKICAGEAGLEVTRALSFNAAKAGLRLRAWPLSIASTTRTTAITTGR
jgi:hypothetical protein